MFLLLSLRILPLGMSVSSEKDKPGLGINKDLHACKESTAVYGSLRQFAD